MKVTVIPAQVTTVEDKIMGSLGLSQLLLLIAPVFIGGGCYIFLPPFSDFHPYKYLLVGVLAVLCILLAIRIKGKLVASWIVVLLRYNLRPRLYVFNKNTAMFREQYEDVTPTEETTTKKETETNYHIPKLDFHTAAKVRDLIDNPERRLRFESTKKGGLYVRLTEIEE